MKEMETKNTNSTAQSAEEDSNEPIVALEPEPLSLAQIDELKEKASKAEENWDRLVRTAADFDNFRKRATREKQDAIRYANESILEKLMPVLDNFEMALAASQAGPTESPQSLQAGVNMILQQLKRALADAGLEEVDATGKLFDPNFHEAVSQQPTTEVPDGHVLRQLRKGYKLHERLLRPASVIVATHPA
jgi:molecular chaperone GrpE